MRRCSDADNLQSHESILDSKQNVYMLSVSQEI